MKRLLAALLAACLLPAFAAEEIRNFSSQIKVLPDSDVVVTETIRVMPEGNQIKRGIYRDFPTLYSSPLGLRTSVPFELLEVLRDGKPEPSRTEQLANGLRIYLGSANVFLPHEETTYTIKYRTGRQLGFYKGYDELYWNVTGNGWSFPILAASACVNLPPGASPRSIEAYTGPKGGKGVDYKTTDKPGCDASLETTKPLRPGEGLTIVVTWPKGFVKAPAQTERVISVFSANRGAVIGAIGLLAVFGYYLVSWILVGRDPKHGVIIPLFAPPEGFTPQEVRYLDGLGTCDNTSLSAAVLHLAVQRSLAITESPGKIYTLSKGDGSKLDGAETHLLESLFKAGSPLILVQSNHSTLTAARNVLAKDLAIQVGPYFARNTGVWVIGLLATLIPLGISLLDVHDKEKALFMMVWLSIWSLGCGALSFSVFKAWQSKNILTALVVAIPLTLFSIPFLAGWFFGMWMLAQFASPWVCGIYAAGITLCVVFQHLLKRPTPEGQKLRDQILGFKKYLSVAEADRLDLENPPERTPQLFEKFLPYALALGVEQAWSEQFADVLAAASHDMDSGPSSTSLVLPLAVASSFTSSFNSAISSASTAPGSSSGSGGGGSSGGGGGGGGGGGW